MGMLSGTQSNLTMSEHLDHTDCAFGDVHEYDTMICSLYEIRQKEGESMEEYMLWIHEAMAVICHTYPDRVTDQGKNLAWDQFYHGLMPSLRDALGFTMAELPESRLAPVLTHCTCWLRRWRCGSLHIHPEVGQDPLKLIGISTGDILPLWDELQCWQRRNCSHPTLIHQTLRHLSQMSLRGWASEWPRWWTTTSSRSVVALCVEQLITLQEIALIGRPSVLGIRSI